MIHSLRQARASSGKHHVVTGEGATMGIVPIAPEFLDRTIAFGQPRYPDRVLTREDARQMIENITGFFRILQKWEEESQRRDDDHR
jgi:hypothetical protein